MKNTIKMSLVAALAVAGLSTTASAGGLEEAIKGVTISGKMEVEYDYVSDKAEGENKNTTNSWDLDWDITAKIPVNDNVTAVFGAEGDTETEIGAESINGDKGADNVQVTKVYFQYANGPVTVLAGKQKIGAPWFDDERANGVVGLFNAGPVTLAAAHFTGANADTIGSNSANLYVDTAFATDMDVAVTLDDADISALAVIGSMGPVNASLWYANIAGITVEAGAAGAAGYFATLDADSYSLNLNATFDIVNVDVRYTKSDYDSQRDNTATDLEGDASLLKIVASADFGVVTPYLGYGMTDKEQHLAGVDLTSDTDSVVDFGGEILSIDELADAKAWIVGVKVPVGALALEAFYIDGDADGVFDLDADIDYNEFYVGADYAMSKNFTVGAHFAKAEVEIDNDTTDYVDAAVSLEYKF